MMNFLRFYYRLTFILTTLWGIFLLVAFPDPDIVVFYAFLVPCILWWLTFWVFCGLQN